MIILHFQKMGRKTPLHLMYEKNIAYLLANVTYKPNEILDILETLIY